MKKLNESEKELKKLVQSLLKRKAEIMPVVLHVSQSGMSRVIMFLYPKGNKIVDVTSLLGKVTGYKYHNRYDGLSIGGCGMDMGFHVVYNAVSAVFDKNSIKIANSIYN